MGRCCLGCGGVPQCLHAHDTWHLVGAVRHMLCCMRHATLFRDTCGLGIAESDTWCAFPLRLCVDTASPTSAGCQLGSALPRVCVCLDDNPRVASSFIAHLLFAALVPMRASRMTATGCGSLCPCRHTVLALSAAVCASPSAEQAP